MFLCIILVLRSIQSGLCRLLQDPKIASINTHDSRGSVLQQRAKAIHSQVFSIYTCTTTSKPLSLNDATKNATSRRRVGELDDTTQIILVDDDDHHVLGPGSFRVILGRHPWYNRCVFSTATSVLGVADDDSTSQQTLHLSPASLYC
jgi:hypothetical protein